MRCEKCGKDYPSMKNFRAPGVCYRCYNFKLSLEEKKVISEQFPEEEKEPNQEKYQFRTLLGYGKLLSGLGWIIAILEV